mmetsp:Transcript_4133/g.12751  ORF Transcript_4133/g.12751 Transcript_4133/m.12751 type:complete len:209 (-) Transcript_4133:987-1613(-)
MRADQCFRLSDDISFGFVHDHSHREEIPSSHLVSSETKLSHSRPSLFLLLVLLLLKGVGVGVGVRVHRRHLFRSSSKATGCFFVVVVVSLPGTQRCRRRTAESARTNASSSSSPASLDEMPFALHKATKKPRQNSRPAKKRRVCVIYICATLSLFFFVFFFGLGRRHSLGRRRRRRRLPHRVLRARTTTTTTTTEQEEQELGEETRLR